MDVNAHMPTIASAAAMPPRLSRRQDGVILFVALIFLVVLTLLGISLYSTTTAEEKMARNYRDVEVATRAAEAAIRDAKIRIKGWWVYDPTKDNTGVLPKPINILAFTSSCTNGLCAGAPQPIDSTKTSSSGVTLGSCGAACDGVDTNYATTKSQPIPGLSSQPKYLIEEIDWQPLGSAAGDPPTQAYRITALGLGRLTTTQVLKQEVYVPGYIPGSSASY